jgi:hypothetical protein
VARRRGIRSRDSDFIGSIESVPQPRLVENTHPT